MELILDFTQTKTARHLAYLKNSGIVSVRKRGQWVLYYLKDEVFEIISQVFLYLNKDHVIMNDQQIHQTLLSNRELAVNKLETIKWKS